MRERARLRERGEQVRWRFPPSRFAYKPKPALSSPTKRMSKDWTNEFIIQQSEREAGESARQQEFRQQPSIKKHPLVSISESFPSNFSALVFSQCYCKERVRKVSRGKEGFFSIFNNPSYKRSILFRKSILKIDSPRYLGFAFKTYLESGFDDVSWRNEGGSRNSSNCTSSQKRERRIIAILVGECGFAVSVRGEVNRAEWDVS